MTRIEREQANGQIEYLEFELKKAMYRYELALRDGAVDSIVKDVINYLNKIEDELRICKATEEITLDQK
jgi:hypothetical protein